MQYTFDYLRYGIGIATLNNPDYLFTVLTDICSTLPNMDRNDIYVIDDGSNTKELTLTRDICNEFKIGLGEHRRNLGISASWNHIIEKLSAKDYVAVLNDDVRLVPEWLESLVYFMVANPICGMAGLHARVQGKLVCTDNSKKEAVKKYEGDIDFKVPHRGICANGFAFMVRPNEARGVQGFDEGYYSFYEEVDFGVRMVQNMGKFGFNIPWPIIDHEWGRTFSSNPELLLPKLRMRRSQERFIGKWGGDISEIYPRLVPANKVPDLAWLTDGRTVNNGKSIDVVR